MEEGYTLTEIMKALDEMFEMSSLADTILHGRVIEAKQQFVLSLPHEFDGGANHEKCGTCGKTFNEGTHRG